MGADNTILGLAVFIGSASEIIFLVFGDRIIKRLGIKFTLFGAAVVAVVRWASLGLINNIFAVLALQILHGLYSLFWPTPWQHISIMRCHLN